MFVGFHVPFIARTAMFVVDCLSNRFQFKFDKARAQWSLIVPHSLRVAGVMLWVTEQSIDRFMQNFQKKGFIEVIWFEFMYVIDCLITTNNEVELIYNVWSSFFFEFCE